MQWKPRVEAAAQSNDAFVLRTINVQRWDSPVAKQYGINSLPRFDVYDPEGKLVASGYEVVEHIVRWDPSQFEVQSRLSGMLAGLGVLLLALGGAAALHKILAPKK